MTQIMAPIHLDAVPTPGQLLGTSGMSSVINSINSSMNMGAEFFGSVNDVFHSGRSAFVKNVIEPTRNLIHKVQHTANSLLKNDVIRPLNEPDDFKFVPPVMHMAVLMHEPVRKLHEQGRVDGFGYDPDWLPKEDTWGRLLNNGQVHDVATAMVDTDDERYGEVEMKFEWWSTDPDHTFEELDYVQTTRDAIDGILKDTSYDPTCYPLHRS